MIDDAALRAFLALRVEQGVLPGAAWWIEGLEDHTAVHGSIGWAAIEPERIPTNEATPYDLASLTKPLATALLLLLLEQQKQVELEAAVGDLLPGLGEPRLARQSLIALASHTAGLEAWRPLYLEAQDLQGFLKAIDALGCTLPPGQTLYSDLGYILLGALLEHVSGSSLGELFEQRIAGPLQSKRIGFADSPGRFEDAAATERGNRYERNLAGRRGRSHPWREKVIRGEVHDVNAFTLGGAAGHAGLFGTVSDVAVIVREMLRPRRLRLGPEACARLFGVVPGSEGRTVGLVTAAASSAARGILPDDAVGHTGFCGTSLWIDRERGCFFVLLTNRVHPDVRESGFRAVRRGFHRIARRVAANATGSENESGAS